MLDGDITAIDFGLSTDDLQVLKETVNIVIHSASTIHLRMPLKELAYTVIAPSLWLADTAFHFKNLTRFVFISTAYANAHLWMEDDATDVVIREQIYPLDDEKQDLLDSAQSAWNDIRKNGTSAEYQAHDFPWPYAYAKHLTERLLLQKASQMNSVVKLLIVRPSVIGPADSFPHPGFSTASSTPTTACAAAYILHPGRQMVFPTRCKNPSSESNIDEVPVDVVVDRTLLHTALGTYGCVHAVSGKDGRVRIQDWAAANNRERRLPWDVTLKWTSEDWHSKELHQLARIFKIIGTSFHFTEDRTFSLLEKLDAEDNSDLKIFPEIRNEYSLVERRHHIREVGLQMAKKKKWPACLVKLLLQS